MHRDPNPRRGATTSMCLIHIRDQRGIIREVQGRSIQESTRALRKGRLPVDRTRVSTLDSNCLEAVYMQVYMQSVRLLLSCPPI